MDEGQYAKQMNIRHDIEVAAEEAAIADRKRKTEKDIQYMLYDLLLGCNIDDIIDEVRFHVEKNKQWLVVTISDSSVFNITIEKGGKK